MGAGQVIEVHTSSSICGEGAVMLFSGAASSCCIKSEKSSIEYWCKEHRWPSDLFVPECTFDQIATERPSRRDKDAQKKDWSETRQEMRQRQSEAIN
jgi:hypothetical protein